MSKIKYRIEKGIHGGLVSASFGTDPEDVVESVLDALDLDIEITVGGVTMHLAAWRDPDHWESDWAEVLNGESVDEYFSRLAAPEEVTA